MDTDLSLEFLRVVEQAAIACAHTMGQGDRPQADQVAVEAMRRDMDALPIDGTIVIGEGERDEAPMLYIGERVGQAHLRRDGTGSYPAGGHRGRSARGHEPVRARHAERDRGAGGVRAGRAAARARSLHGEADRRAQVEGRAVDLDAPVADNLRAIARCLDRDVDDLVVVVLDRPRHETADRRHPRAGARIRLIGDGDLSAGIAAAVVGSGVHAVMGIGGAPEGVLTAAAMRCLNGEIFARLVVRKPEDERRCREMGIDDVRRVYRSEDLASGENIIFAATGVTDGTLMKGVRFFGDGIRTSSLVMQTRPHLIRFIDSIYVQDGQDVRIQF